ncbi:MAG: DUF475 domain-containing protein [Saprospiraceae bacterium]
MFDFNSILQSLAALEWDGAALIILNLILIESLLSVDNAAVLAAMVMDLPPEQRPRALRYGIIGAYAFRGLCLIFAVWLIRIWWLKPLGGLYLLYLCYDYFRAHKKSEDSSSEPIQKEQKWFYRLTVAWMGPFWATVVAVELMDLAFSIDNVFAAVAFTQNIVLICIGVFIGILAMRFVAQYFVRLMESYPFLEKSAFIVIGILGFKLLLSLPMHFWADQQWVKALESETADFIVSLVTAAFFFFPVALARFRGSASKSQAPLPPHGLPPQPVSVPANERSKVE